MANQDVSTGVKTTNTSFDIIDYVKEVNGATLTEIATRLGLAKSTVHDHLLTLVDRGYLTRTGTTYTIGLRFFNIGMYCRDQTTANQLALENVRGLARRTNEEASYGVEDNGQVITLYDIIGYEIERNQNVGVFKIGKYYDMHCTAGGKAILAEHPEESVVRILEERGLPQRTPNTITSHEALFEELESIRETGYAVIDEEFVLGHRSAAAVVRNPDDSVAGALTIQGPAYRISVDRLVRICEEELLQSARNLEAKIEANIAPGSSDGSFGDTHRSDPYTPAEQFIG